MDDAGLAMTKLAAFFEDDPGDDAVIAREETEFGWRGLTARGDILNVRSRDGSKAAMPAGDVVLMRGGEAISSPGGAAAPMNIGDYLAHYDRATALMRANRNAEALVESDAVMAMAPTLFARFNRSLILLALGRWREGFAHYRECEGRAPFIRPPVVAALAAGLAPWNGENLAGKRLLLIHAHGFGDTIMALRYVPMLQALGAEVILYMPAELDRLARRFAHVTHKIQHADFFCPILHLLGLLNVEPGDVTGAPYVSIDSDAIKLWRAQLPRACTNIGIAWSPGNGGRQHDGDYPRAIALDRIVHRLGKAQLHSVQKHGALEARALGVQVHDFDDFEDCAALMLAMDRIVTIDTAAVHLAGAIGHPRVDALLSRWASWRWQAQWYANVRLEVLDG